MRKLLPAHREITWTTVGADSSAVGCGQGVWISDPQVPARGRSLG